MQGAPCGIATARDITGMGWEPQIDEKIRACGCATTTSSAERLFVFGPSLGGEFTVTVVEFAPFT
jgi:hypothetical protein